MRRLSPLLSQFHDYLRYTRSRSEKTAAAYVFDALQLERHLAPRGSALLSASREEVKGYLKHLASARAVTTRARRMTGLCAFFAFAVSRGLRAENPLDGMGRPRRSRSTRTALTVDQVLQLLDGPWAETELALRDRTILELLYGAGLRNSELATLRLENVDWQGGMLKVLGKGMKERLCPVNKGALRALAEYLEKRGGDTSRGVALYAIEGKPLDGKTVHYRMKRLGQRHGLKLNPHTLRHAYATHMLERGAKISDLQLLMGHASSRTTALYTHPTLRHLQRIYGECHPHAHASTTSLPRSCRKGSCEPARPGALRNTRRTTPGWCPIMRRHLGQKAPRRPRKKRNSRRTGQLRS